MPAHYSLPAVIAMRASQRTSPESCATSLVDVGLRSVISRYSLAWKGAASSTKETAPVTTLVPLLNYLRQRALPGLPVPGDTDGAMRRAALRCDLCDVDATSAEHLATHMKGQKHTRRVLFDKTDAEIAARFQEDSQLRKIDPGKWRCDPCASDMCALAVAAHMDGARHRNQLRRWLVSRSASPISPRTSSRLVCRPCSFTTPSETALSAHLGSEAHRRVVNTAVSSPPRPTVRPLLSLPLSPTLGAPKPVGAPQSPVATSPKSLSAKDNSPKPLNAFAKVFRPSSNTPNDTRADMDKQASGLSNESTAAPNPERQLEKLPDLPSLTQPALVSEPDVTLNEQPSSEPSRVDEHTCSCGVHCSTTTKRKWSEGLSVSSLLSVEIMPASSASPASGVRLRVNPTLSTASVDAQNTAVIEKKVPEPNEASSKNPIPVSEKPASSPSEPSDKPDVVDNRKGAASSTTNGLSNSDFADTDTTEVTGNEMQYETTAQEGATAPDAPANETPAPLDNDLLGSVTPLVQMFVEDAEMEAPATQQPAAVAVEGVASTPIPVGITLPPPPPPGATSSISQVSAQRSKRKASPLKKGKQVTCSKNGERDMSAFYCAVCKVQCNADPPFQEHLRSTRHSRSVAFASASDSTVSGARLSGTRAMSPVANVRNKGKTSPPRKKKKSASVASTADEFACALCQVVCNGNEPLQEHLRSSRHMRRANEAARTIESPDSRMFAAEPTPQLFPPAASKQPIICVVCDVPCTSAENYRAHIAGKLHNRRLNSYRESQREPPSSSSAKTGSEPAVMNGSVR